MSWWRDHFQVYRAPDQISAEIRSRHLHAITRLTPVTMAASVLNGTFICFAFWNSVPRVDLLAWMGMLTFAAALATRAWWRRRGRSPGRASPAAIRRATIELAVRPGRLVCGGRSTPSAADRDAHCRDDVRGRLHTRHGSER